MRKQDLYDFIETKLDRTKNGLSKQINEIHVIVKEAASKEFKGLDNITRLLTNASNSMEEIKEKHKDILGDYYATNRDIRECHSAIYFSEDAINKLKDVGKFSLEDNREDTRKVLARNYPFFLSLLDGIRKDYNTIQKNIDDVDTLKSELFGVIKGSRSGKDAYKNLVALNVNMSGFEDAQATLPAVQKLSVDVCVINEDCK